MPVDGRSPASIHLIYTCFSPYLYHLFTYVHLLFTSFSPSSYLSPAFPNNISTRYQEGQADQDQHLVKELPFDTPSAPHHDHAHHPSVPALTLPTITSPNPYHHHRQSQHGSTATTLNISTQQMQSDNDLTVLNRQGTGT
jgi:hypothetical protein